MTWSSKISYTNKLHVIPEKHRKKVLIEQGAEGDYTISDKVKQFHKDRCEACAQNDN